MPLRLRRGTDAERLTITPAEGEPIYITDTKSLYVGDGTTQGGTLITGAGGAASLDDLTDVDLTTPPTTGQVLKWDGSKFIAAADTGSGAASLNDLIDVDLTSNLPNVGEVLKWNGSKFVPSADIDTQIILSNASIFDLTDVFEEEESEPEIGDTLIFNGFHYVSQPIFFISGINNSIMLDATTNTFTGKFVGDGSGLTNLPGGSGTSISSIFDLNDVSSSPPEIGDVLQFDGFNFISQKITGIDGIIEGSNYRINIVGDDSSIMLDTSTNTFRGKFLGDDSTILVDGSDNTHYGSFVGDGSRLTNLPQSEGVVEGSNYRINIIGSDSSDIVDSVNNIINANSINTNVINSGSGKFATVNNTLSDSISSIVSFVTETNSTVTNETLFLGRILFSLEENDQLTTPSVILGSNSGIFFATSPDGILTGDKYFSMTSTGLGIGKFFPEQKLDVNGNASVSGFVQFGSLTTTERNTLTAANGMVIYNSTDNKFQGYENGVWVNLV